MMRELYVAIGTICSVIVATWAWKMLNWVWFKPRKLEAHLWKQGLKGNSYRFLFGDMNELFKMRSEARDKPIPFTHDHIPRVLPFVHHIRNEFGRNNFTWLGPVPAINITEPELIREALTRMNDFQKAKLNPLVGLLAPGLVSLEGEKWAFHRRLINPAFHMEKLKLMLPAIYAGIIDSTNKWDNLISETGFVELDVFPYIQNLTADVISRAAFGSSYEEGKKMFELLKEQAHIAIRLFKVGFIPGWKYLPTKTNRKMKELNAKIQCSLKGMIDNRKKAMEAGEAAKNDLLGTLLESNFRESQIYAHNKLHRLAMTLQDVIDECKLFYFAGQETTSVLLVWTLILLSKYQDWQMRAREEVLATFGEDQPDFDGLNRLKTVTMILYEVLRLYPPLTAVSRRLHGGETMLGNLSIPEGAMIGLAILQVHHDPKLWGDDAKEFKPERFSEGIAKATKGNLSFFPFGGGPRICIGQNFALSEAKMALVVILQRFSLELSPSYAHAPSSAITLQPQFGAQLILRRL